MRVKCREEREANKRGRGRKEFQGVTYVETGWWRARS